MTRKRSGLKNPNVFTVTMQSSVAAHELRYHCFEQEMGISDAVEEAIIDYLIKAGRIVSRESLEIQEQIEK